MAVPFIFATLPAGPDPAAQLDANFAYVLVTPAVTPPRTITAASDTPSSTDVALICNFAGTVTLTLPLASSFSGRTFRIKTITANTVISASSDIIPLIGGGASTAILAATAGKWADITSNGTDWEIMAAN
jgi:hypothetical protein